MKNKLLILSVLQSIYIIYILNYFKTRYSFAHPLLDFSSSYFKHPIGINNTSPSFIINSIGLVLLKFGNLLYTSSKL